VTIVGTRPGASAEFMLAIDVTFFCFCGKSIGGIRMEPAGARVAAVAIGAK
jgi:hypothetical protein